MKRTVTLVVVATLTLSGQKIETQKPDRNRITRLGTTENHLSVIELSEPVTQVAAGSSSFKIEWRDNKVFIQPLEPDVSTNLFIWTASARLSYELVPAASVEQMHFAIDQEPLPVQARDESPQQPQSVEKQNVPTAMLLEGTPVKAVGSSKNRQKVEIRLHDVYKKDHRIYLRYAIVNGGRGVYQPAAPAVFKLNSPRAPQSLIPLANSQLMEDHQLKWNGETRVPVVHTELQSSVVRAGETAYGVTAFDLPRLSQPRERTVVRLTFPADSVGTVNAVLVL